MIVRWDANKPRDVDLAKKVYRHAVDKAAVSGHVYNAKAYRLKRGDKQGDELLTFDATAGAMMLVFP